MIREFKGFKEFKEFKGFKGFKGFKEFGEFSIINYQFSTPKGWGLLSKRVVW